MKKIKFTKNSVYQTLLYQLWHLPLRMEAALTESDLGILIVFSSMTWRSSVGAWRRGCQVPGRDNPQCSGPGCPWLPLCRMVTGQPASRIAEHPGPTCRVCTAGVQSVLSVQSVEDPPVHREAVVLCSEDLGGDIVGSPAESRGGVPWAGAGCRVQGAGCRVQGAGGWAVGRNYIRTHAMVVPEDLQQGRYVWDPGSQDLKLMQCCRMTFLKWGI